jgi:hypothetical protein
MAVQPVMASLDRRARIHHDVVDDLVGGGIDGIA